MADLGDYWWSYWVMPRPDRQHLRPTGELPGGFQKFQTHSTTIFQSEICKQNWKPIEIHTILSNLPWSDRVLFLFSFFFCLFTFKFSFGSQMSERQTDKVRPVRPKPQSVPFPRRPGPRRPFPSAPHPASHPSPPAASPGPAHLLLTHTERRDPRS